MESSHASDRTGEAAKGRGPSRSIASQIEFWARVGKAVEGVLRGDRVLQLKQRGEAVPLAALLESADSKVGRGRVKAQQSAPHSRTSSRHQGGPAS